MIKLGIVMDPIATINIKKDTSFAMLLEAQRRGYELHYMEMNDLYLINGEALALTRTLSVEQNYDKWYEFTGEQHWWVYLTALLISFFAMIPFIIYGEKKRKMKRVLLGAVATLMLTELFFWQFGDSLRALVIGTVVFFTAFNLLEASLPSLISKVSPAGGKGTAMGVYSTSQFLGSALGGILGGWLFQHGGLSVVFLGGAGLAALWLAFAVTMREPPYVTSLRLPLSPEALREAGLTERLKAVAGVTDAVIVAEEAAIYIKLDTELLDRATLEQLVNPAPTCEA